MTGGDRGWDGRGPGPHGPSGLRGSMGGRTVDGDATHHEQLGPSQPSPPPTGVPTTAGHPDGPQRGSRAPVLIVVSVAAIVLLGVAASVLIRFGGDGDSATAPGSNGPRAMDLLLTSEETGGLPGEVQAFDGDQAWSEWEDVDISTVKMYRGKLAGISEDELPPPAAEGEAAIDAYVDEKTGGDPAGCWRDSPPRVSDAAGVTYGDAWMPPEGPSAGVYVEVLSDEEAARRHLQQFIDPDAVLVDDWRERSVVWWHPNGTMERTCGPWWADVWPCSGFEDCWILDNPDISEAIIRRGAIVARLHWSDDAPVQGDDLIQKTIDRIS